MKEKMRDSGFESIGEIPWGTHFCQFYQTKEDMMELLVPYLKAGLKDNEFCLWVTSQLLDVEKTKEALRIDIPDLDIYLEEGQIEIIHFSLEDFNKNIPDLERLVNDLIKKLNNALTDGYDGLRLIKHNSSEKKESHEVLDNFEEEVDSILDDLPIIALCTYSLENYRASEIIDVINNHRFALNKKEGKWEQIENSRQKKKEDEIQILSNLVDSSDDAIITKSLNGIITSWNKGAERIYGYSAKEVVGKPISILEPPILKDETNELIEYIKCEERIHHYETLRLRKDGKIINVSLTLSSIFGASGNPKAILIIARDITESKHVEEKLQKKEEMYRIVTEQTGLVIYDFDLRTDICKWAGAIKEVTGYNFHEIEMLGKYFWLTNIEHINDKISGTGFHNLSKSGDRYKEDLRLRKKNGSYIYIENKGIFLKDNEGCPYEAIGIIKDITDWKLIIKKIEDSEGKYRSFIQNFYGIVYQRDENFSPVFMHGAIEEITGYNEQEFESNIKWKDIIHPDDLSLVLKEEERVRSIQSTGYANIEYRIKRRDGRTKWVNEIYQKIKRGDERSELYQGTIYDVTTRKETEKFLENIENARKKEIHHRIKNNLQVISSLLDLQAEKFRNNECINETEVLKAFEESQNRVISMSLIHEELYKGGEIDTLNFSAYLHKLVENLFQTYSLNSKDLHLNMDLEKNAFFDMDIAVPLGIIVNELISNSLKYAFCEGEAGEIRIRLCRNENNKESHKSLYSLIVSDNGKGIPEDIELGNLDSLGLQLVSILVDQLDGEIKLERDHGTEFEITFEVNDVTI